MNRVFEAAQWPYVYFRIVFVSLNHSVIEHLSSMQGMVLQSLCMSLCCSFTSFSPASCFPFLSSYPSCWAFNTWHQCLLLPLLGSCERRSLLLASPQLLPARSAFQLTAGQAIPRTSSSAVLNHMHWWNLIEAVPFLHGELPIIQTEQIHKWGWGGERVCSITQVPQNSQEKPAASSGMEQTIAALEVTASCWWPSIAPFTDTPCVCCLPGSHCFPFAILRAASQPGGVHLPVCYWHVWTPVLHWEPAGIYQTSLLVSLLFSHWS